MGKNPVAKKHQKIPEFDFSDFMLDDSPTDEAVVGMMSGLIEAHRHQQQVAMDLTKLVIENTATKPMSEEAIFSTFKRACQIAGENSPLKEFLEKMTHP